MPIHFDIDKIQNTAPTVPELVLDSLLAAMENGKLSVGEELPPERELADALGISRNSLRECLSIMSFMGILENRGNRKPEHVSACYATHAFWLRNHEQKTIHGNLPGCHPNAARLANK